MIWALILAAGESKRMGKPKLLLPFGETTIIETVVATVTESRVDKILVVVGADRGMIEEKLKNFHAQTAVNSSFQKGMLSSVKLGFQTIPKNSQAALVILGDQPLIPISVINKLIEAYEKTRKGIILPVYHHNRGHPVLIDMKYRADIQALSPEVGLRSLVYSHPEDTLEVEVDSPAILKDIDTIEDYKRNNLDYS